MKQNLGAGVVWKLQQKETAHVTPEPFTWPEAQHRVGGYWSSALYGAL